jgi:predicted O-methyltransferase YrrM
MFFPGALKYVKYILFSGHRKGHGLHSPFVFNLVSQVFRNKISPDIVLMIEKIREKMISDQGSISVNDLGNGSLRMKTSLRKVSEIARYSSVPKKYGILLSNMSAEFGEPVVIEFGTSLGISTMYMAASCPDGIVYTMEGCPETSEIAKKNFQESGLTNIMSLTGSFEQLLPGIKKETSQPGLVFIDGNHKKEPLINYFNQVAEISSGKTVVIIDDIHSSRRMEEAWAEVKNHEKVTFSIDIFRMGLVFFREGMNHIDYIIRY